jgi:aromatic ring-opening dioxygenase catalytic subunit (LigB family)
MHSKQGSVLYLSHGGGPLPLLGDKAHQRMVSTLKEISSQLRRPDAIIVISAHWEERQATVTTGAAPSLLYDYYGFPEASYSIEYPAPGSPELAQRVLSRLQDQGIEASASDRRGFDHGLFVPLKILYPDAEIPCIQLSLINNLDPQQHIQLGSALSGLLEENLLFIGSGFSFHNLRAFFSPQTSESQALNNAFETWLIDTCGNPQLSEQERERRLTHWADAPGARFCHPREEHLLPLHVCYGLAGVAADKTFHIEVMGKQASMYLW